METSPLSKFLGICTTIQGHDLLNNPINKTVGAPSLSSSLQAFANPSLPRHHHQRGSKNQWRVAATGAVPPPRRKEAAPARVEGSDRHVLL
jgi:hypothetical protein